MSYDEEIRPRLVRIALAALLLLAVGAAASYAALTLRAAEPDPVEQYYRGAYDLCVAVLGTDYAESCLQGTRKAYEKDRHEESSYRWRWPIPTPTPTTDPDREARQ